MKKMWIIAAVACAALMVSCGGEKKSENVEAKATVYAIQLIEAIKSGDEAKVEKLRKEAGAWINTLSEADQEKADAVGDKLFKEAGLR